VGEVAAAIAAVAVLVALLFGGDHGPGRHLSLADDALSTSALSASVSHPA